MQAVKQQDGFDYGGCEYGCKASYTSETTKQAYNQQEDGSFSTYLYGLDSVLLSRVQVVDGELDMEKIASGNYVLEGAYVSTEVSWMKAVSIIPLEIKSKYPAMESCEISQYWLML